MIKQATDGEPQAVTVHGKPTAVVISADEYRRLTTRSGSLSAALLNPELAGDDLDISRSRDTGRETPL